MCIHLSHPGLLQKLWGVGKGRERHGSGHSDAVQKKAGRDEAHEREEDKECKVRLHSSTATMGISKKLKSSYSKDSSIPTFLWV